MRRADGGRVWVSLTIANAALYERVNTNGERLRVLSRRLMEVREAEQRGLARELHDELGQSLSALRITLETAQGAPVPAGAEADGPQPGG